MSIEDWKLYCWMEWSELKEFIEGKEDMRNRYRDEYDTGDYTGRKICNALRAIRIKIAKENGISYMDDECTSKGPCRGTCPRCDAEIYYLNEELRKKRERGEKIIISGIGEEDIRSIINASVGPGYQSMGAAQPLERDIDECGIEDEDFKYKSIKD